MDSNVTLLRTTLRFSMVIVTSTNSRLSMSRTIKDNRKDLHVNDTKQVLNRRRVTTPSRNNIKRNRGVLSTNNNSLHDNIRSKRRLTRIISTSNSKMTNKTINNDTYRRSTTSSTLMDLAQSNINNSIRLLTSLRKTSLRLIRIRLRFRVTRVMSNTRILRNNIINTRLITNLSLLVRSNTTSQNISNVITSNLLNEERLRLNETRTIDNILNLLIRVLTNSTRSSIVLASNTTLLSTRFKRNTKNDYHSDLLTLMDGIYKIRKTSTIRLYRDNLYNNRTTHIKGDSNSNTNRRTNITNEIYAKGKTSNTIRHLGNNIQRSLYNLANSGTLNLYNERVRNRRRRKNITSNNRDLADLRNVTYNSHGKTSLTTSPNTSILRVHDIVMVTLYLLRQRLYTHRIIFRVQGISNMGGVTLLSTITRLGINNRRHTNSRKLSNMKVNNISNTTTIMSIRSVTTSRLLLHMNGIYQHTTTPTQRSSHRRRHYNYSRHSTTLFINLSGIRRLVFSTNVLLQEDILYLLIRA